MGEAGAGRRGGRKEGGGIERSEEAMAAAVVVVEGGGAGPFGAVPSGLQVTRAGAGRGVRWLRARARACG